MTSKVNTALGGFRENFAGQVILPDESSYDDARTIFNAMIDRRPTVIAQCQTVDDVTRAIRFGRDNELEIAVRGGGHSVAGLAVTEGGIVVDLRRMNAVTVDPVASTARVGGGATMSDLDRATEPHGLMTTGGRVSTTGVGGLVLGGGSGWLERKFGLACDNLLSVDLVTADGTAVRASADENPELFWALHGGGGNFGVATSFTFRLFPLPAATLVVLLWTPEAGPRVARAYRDFMASAPDEVGGGLLYLTGPPEEFVPEHLVGRLACVIVATYAGEEAAARQVLASLLELGHEGELIAEMPYAELQCALDDPPGYRNYWSAEYLDAFPDQAADQFCARANDMIAPSPSQQALLPQGGAVTQAAENYPLPWRRAPWVVHPYGVWESPGDDERGKQWVRDVRADLLSWASGAVYLNFIGDEGEDRVIAGFGRDNYNRLAAIKADYDPDNVFRLNHNIKPVRP